MDQAAAKALSEDLVVDITTIGRNSGEARKIEIWIHEVEGRYYITGSPGTRSWYSNLLKDPALTVHLKKSHTADLSARAIAISGREQKQALFQSAKALSNNINDENIEEWLAKSPLVEIIFD